MSTGNSALAGTALATSAIALSRSRDNRSIDFFCKTEEHKTQLEIQYCEEFYEKKEAVSDVVIIIILAMFVTFAILLYKAIKG